MFHSSNGLTEKRFDWQRMNIWNLINDAKHFETFQTVR